MPHHIIGRLRDSAQFATSLEEARQLSSSHLGFARRHELVLFAFPGDHIHLGTLAGRVQAGKTARASEASVTYLQRREIGFREGTIRRVRGHAHLAALPHYFFNQFEHHGIEGDPLLESTNLLDLLSFRLVDPWCAGALKHALPDLTRHDLARHLGGYPERGTDPRRLREAALVVSGGLPFRCTTQLGSQVRYGAIRIALELGWTMPYTRAQFGVSQATIRRALNDASPEVDYALWHVLGLVERRVPDGFPERIVLPDVVTWRREQAPTTHHRPARR